MEMDQERFTWLMPAMRGCPATNLQLSRTRGQFMEPYRVLQRHDKADVGAGELHICGHEHRVRGQTVNIQGPHQRVVETRSLQVHRLALKMYKRGGRFLMRELRAL